MQRWQSDGCKDKIAFYNSVKRARQIIHFPEYIIYERPYLTESRVTQLNQHQSILPPKTRTFKN